jgi:hypothetical protein
VERWSFERGDEIHFRDVTGCWVSFQSQDTFFDVSLCKQYPRVLPPDSPFTLHIHPSSSADVSEHGHSHTCEGSSSVIFPKVSLTSVELVV